MNEALRALFEADQADRLAGPGGLTAETERRDRERLEAVLRAVDAGEARTPDDLYHCAMVLQHGWHADHQKLAHELALRAADGGHGGARWLAAAALDRWLMRTGRPQRFGTQYVRTDAAWSLYDLDPATTDEERRAWDVPALAEILAVVDELNAEQP